MNTEPFRVKPGEKVDLEKVSPDIPDGWRERKEESLDKLEKLRQELGELQDVLFAQHKHRLLVVLQAMDTGGKDGTIRSVFTGVNPQGVRVASFKAPTPIELDHDYLWRVHAQVPGRGEITIFNRSHYEDVLVVRVHEFVPESTWKRRFEQINQFEEMLAEEGVTILKFYLHISQEEQKERLLERIDTPEKQWKFNPGDLEERKYWGDYMKAFEDVLTKTSTRCAPWYIIPANRNWFRNLLVETILVDTLKGLDLSYPPPAPDIHSYRSKII